MLLEPEWEAPAHVRAFTTLRSHSNDNAALTALLADDCRLQRLRQVHGTAVVDAQRCVGEPDADACYSRCGYVGCMIVTADCLPLLVCNSAGNEVAAIHAGWRGLVGGIIENTLQGLQSATGDLMVWLGPAISQAHFEVGPEVRSDFLDCSPSNTKEATADCFVPGRDDRYMADLYQLARLRLWALGVNRISGGSLCTFSDSRRFHSWRRDGQAAGRMASVIAFY